MCNSCSKWRYTLPAPSKFTPSYQEYINSPNSVPLLKTFKNLTSKPVWPCDLATRGPVVYRTLAATTLARKSIQPCLMRSLWQRRSFILFGPPLSGHRPPPHSVQLPPALLPRLHRDTFTRWPGRRCTPAFFRSELNSSLCRIWVVTTWSRLCGGQANWWGDKKVRSWGSRR